MKFLHRCRKRVISTLYPCSIWQVCNEEKCKIYQTPFERSTVFNFFYHQNPKSNIRIYDQGLKMWNLKVIPQTWDSDNSTEGKRKRKKRHVQTDRPLNEKDTLFYHLEYKLHKKETLDILFSSRKIEISRLQSSCFGHLYSCLLFSSIIWPMWHWY